jgi:hypothetical protein
MVNISNPFNKQEKKSIEEKNWSFPFKFSISKNKRPFRLSGIEKTDSGYYIIILWLDTNLFETFAYDKIEPYLKSL